MRLFAAKIVLAFLFLSSSILLGQVGSLDTTFNPIDKIGKGYGEISNGAGLNTIQKQSDGKYIIAGGFSSFNATAVSGVARLDAKGARDTTYTTGLGFSGAVYSSAIQADDKMIFGGVFSKYNNQSYEKIIRLNTDGSVDTTFKIGTGFNDRVSSITVLSDGKIIITGTFTTYNGLTKNRIVKLNVDGSVDNTFNVPNGANNGITSVRVQNDGKVIVCGYFTVIGGTAKNRVARLNANGSVDNTFNVGTGFEADVNTLELQSDGKVVLAGRFLTYNGNSAKGIARLTTNGSFDSTFDTGIGFQGTVYTSEILPNDKILFGGGFDFFNGVKSYGAVQLNSNGSIDTTFNLHGGFQRFGWIGSVADFLVNDNGSVLVIGSFDSYNDVLVTALAKLDSVGKIDDSFHVIQGANGPVYAISQYDDGKLIIGGAFTIYNGKQIRSLIKISSHGSIDTTFETLAISSGTIRKIHILPDNKLILVGGFTVNTGINGYNIVRLQANGKIDSTFDIGTGFNDFAYESVLQPDGKIIVVGRFTAFNGVNRNGIARLNQDGSLDNTFDPGSGTTSGITGVSLDKSGKIIIVGLFTSFNGTNLSKVARLNPNGTIDATFNIGAGFDGNVFKSTIQKDGKIIFVGAFNHYNNDSAYHIARINPNGSIDSSFKSKAGAQSSITAVHVQADQKIIIGGWFNSYNGVNANRIARINTDGSADVSFVNPQGVNDLIEVITTDLYGNVLIGGAFTSCDGKGKTRLARLIGDSPSDQLCNWSLNFTGVKNLNCDDTLASSTAQVLNATSPVTYSWKNAYSTLDSVAFFKTEGSYKCVVQDSIGCKDSASLFIANSKFPNGFDVSSTLTAASFRTGFDNYILLDVFNQGCSVQDGQLYLVLDSLVEFLSAVPSPDYINEDTIVWNYSSIQYLKEKFVPKVYLKTKLEAAIGDTVHLKTIVTPTIADLDSTNNRKDYYYPVINGYDPNDISVNPLGRCPEGFVAPDQLLTYTVRFQNTGNAEAVNINVVDSLDQNLDLSTFRILSSSDTMYTQILKGNVVKFVFDSIMLVDSTHDEPASHGYIVYEISPKTGLSDDVQLKNRAAIYFDFNPAVLTNTTLNTIKSGDLLDLCKPTLIQQKYASQFFLYPNPSEGVFTLTGIEIPKKVTILNQMGGLIQTIVPTSNVVKIDVSKKSTGLYFVRVDGLQSTVVLKAIVK